MPRIGWKCVAFALPALLLALGAADAATPYFRRAPSDLNASILQIDEKSFLGRSMDAETPLIDHTGRTFLWRDMFGKPTILVLAYYTCDGSCAVVNMALLDLLKQAKRLQAGVDFNVVTLSFDRHDTLETTGAFRKHLDLTRELAANWTFATFSNEADLTTQTEKIGFKFFWSPADRIFLHPGAYLFFSPEGKLARVLYQQEIEGKDIELAVLDARQGQFAPREVINFALSLCYSYNYQDGHYSLNMPLLIGLGALTSGLVTFLVFILVFKITRRKRLIGA
ncbi:SCO family protein [Bradyrhizobium sp.]|uniref:SCO family protein n=1 Tax=Bradyrhizobium sp. TaxID=376 RepID=UPI001D48391C|nr:SCO family protein [Bradyrhizobium sp.]MBI5320038.1 SCO family protein [Bradyrhizobium sp.]